jgi:hypothetical protein
MRRLSVIGATALVATAKATSIQAATDALEGADAILGQPDFDSVRPGTGRNKLHTVSALSFDGSYLWVGEVKFSERLLRFSPVS